MVKKNNLFESVEAEIIDGAKDFVKEKVKKKVIRIGEISILILLSFIMISIGLGQILANMYPILMGGYSYLLLGITFLLISYLMKI